MKKIISIFITAALILSTAACGNNEDSSKKDADGKVTQVAFGAPEEEDTTKEAIEYLNTQIPLFAKYLETRRGIPLTFKTEVNTPDTSEITEICIRDKDSVAVSATNSNGDVTRIVYMDKAMYYIDNDEKTIYVSESTKEGIRGVVDSYRLNIKLEDAQMFNYESDTATYNDTSYKHEVIYSGSAPAHYYYDEGTEELKYIVSGETETKVLVLENTVDEDIFELPAGYKKATYEEYIEKIRAEQASEAQTQAAE